MSQVQLVLITFGTMLITGAVIAVHGFLTAPEGREGWDGFAPFSAE